MSGIGLALGASKIVGIDWFGIIKRWWPVILAAMLAAYIAILHGEIRHWKKVAANETALARQAQSALKTTVASYRAAAAAATKADADNKARVEAAQAKTTKEVSSEYQAKIAALRAAYARSLQHPATPAHSSGPGSEAVPNLPDASARTDGPPAPSADAAFNCSANSVQLQALQDWLKGEEAIPR